MGGIILNTKKILTGIVAAAFLATSLLTGFAVKELVAHNYLIGNKYDIITDVFHDQGYIFMDPIEPTSQQEVIIRLRALRYGLTKAQIQLTADGGETWEIIPMEFEKVDESGYYDYWKGIIPPQSSSYTYRFICGNENYTAYVTHMGPVNTEPRNTDFDFFVKPDFKTPDWTKGALWYSIMPDAFYNGDVLTDKTTTGRVRENAWGNVHYGGIDWFGGDLKGIESKIEYIRDMINADAVFINPIWKTDHNAGYGSADIQQIDSALGTEQDLVDLVKSLHENDMKIMLDAVFKYYLADGTWFNEAEIFPLPGAAQDRLSPFYSVFKFYQWPNQRETDWGQPVINFGIEAARDFIYTKPESLMNLFMLEPYNIDGWRMDVGNTLWGHDRSAHEILKDMRTYLKQTKPEAIFLSEHAAHADIYDYTLDSMWNYDFGLKVRDWALGDRSQAVLDIQLAQGVRKLPRPIGLSSYNFLTTHDESRINLHLRDNPHLMNAAQLLIMTYLGSPSVFFGDEIGMIGENAPGVNDKAPTSFSSFNWDHTTWNYQIFNMQRALGELRVEHPALRLGVVKTVLVDNDKKLYGFGRWDETGKVISVISQNENMVSATIKAHEVSAKDGTVFTDYLTGREYTVRNGLFEAQIMPGGAVFVMGDAGKFRNIYEIYNLNQAEGSIRNTNINSYELEGKGQIGGNQDKLKFAAANVYNNFVLDLQLYENNKGKFALVARNSIDENSSAFILEIGSGEIKSLVRKNGNEDLAEIGKAKIEKNSHVRLSRENNVFRVYLADDNQGNPGEFIEINELSGKANMGFSAYAGFAPLSGKTIINNVSLNKSNPQLFDDFSGSVLGSMFDVSGEGELDISEGKLSLKANSGIKSLTAIAPLSDWSARSKFEFDAAEGEFAGVIAKQDNLNYVSTGRTTIDGERLIYFGQTINGIYIDFASVKDSKPSAEIIVQIQRSGTRYTAIYSYDGLDWITLGTGLFANYSDAKAGIFVSGDSLAVFDYAGFGNGWNKGTSYNNSITLGNIDTDYRDMARISSRGKYVIASGEWSYKVGGLLQSLDQGEARIDYWSKSFNDVRIESTIKAVNNNGYAGISFGKSDPDSPLNSGYLVKLTSENQIVLLDKNDEIARVDIPVDLGTPRLLVEAVGEKINVYYGKNGTPLISLTETGYKGGYVSFVSMDASVSFENYNIFDYYSKWTIASGGMVSALDGVILSTQGAMDAWANLNGIGVTDIAIGTNLQVSQASTTSRGIGGILLGASAGTHPDQGGLLFSLDTAGNLLISEKGERLAETQIEGDISSVYLIIVAQEGHYKIYLDDQITPVLDYREDFTRSGALTFYANAAKSVFANLKIYGLGSGEKYENLELYKSREKFHNMNELAVETFRDNFNSPDSLENWIPYEGDWSIKDGAYYCTSPSSWSNGTSSTSGRYNDFDMNFKMKMDGGQGFMSVIFRKNNLNDSHEMSGYMMYANSAGLAVYKNNFGEIAKGSISGWANGQWADFRIVARGNRIEVYVNGVKAIDFTDDSYFEGFISLNAGMATGAFDDVVIRPLS